MLIVAVCHAVAGYDFAKSKSWPLVLLMASFVIGDLALAWAALKK